MLAIWPAASALAQEVDLPEAGPPPSPETTEDTIIVFGRRLVGAVEAPQPPLLELGEEEIAAYGAGSIAELLQQLAPQITSARGRGGGGGFPVILVNGARISSFRELRSYPPEAIERVEVLPEEVAQSYGFSPDQRVVNFILKDNFASREVELEHLQPWDGGSSTQEIEATYLSIDGPSRLNVNLEFETTSLLTQAERGIVQSDAPSLASDPDPARFRSLIGNSSGLEGTANWSRQLARPGSSLSLNATHERSEVRRLLGLDTVRLTDPAGASVLRSVNAQGPLALDSRVQTTALGTALNAPVDDWTLTATADARLVDASSRIDRRLETAALQAAAAVGTLALDASLGPFTDAGRDTANTKTTSVAALVTMRGKPVSLPAGDVSLTLDAGYDWNRIASQDTRRLGGETALVRGALTAGVNIGIPLAGRSDDVLAELGDIDLNLAVGLDHLSDFGTLTDTSASLTWGLTERLTATLSYITRDSAPSLGQLGEAEIATPNVPAFDFATGETTLVTLVGGGNLGLPAQRQRDWKVGLVWQANLFDQATISLDYIRNRSDDVAAGFPLLTPAIEAAFPARVVRDGEGQLVRIDERPVSFARQDVERLQLGINLGGQIGRDADGAGAGTERGGGRRGEPSAMASGGGPVTATGAPSARFEPARFAALRQLLCGENGAEVALQLARGEAVSAPDGSAVSLPPAMVAQLGEGGEPDPVRVEQVRLGVCNAEPAQVGAPAADPPPASTDRGGSASRPSARGGGRGIAGIMGRGPGGAGRWFANISYTLELDNKVLVAPGGPLLDLLNGDALAGGGQSRHRADALVGTFYKGFGSFLNARYVGSSRIEGGELPGSTDLFFGDLFTLDWRVFVDMGRQESAVERFPFLDDVRISLDVENIFDTRQQVIDSTGMTPLRYQPFLIDPLGRTFEIELRKLF